MSLGGGVRRASVYQADVTSSRDLPPGGSQPLLGSRSPFVSPFYSPKSSGEDQARNC